MKEEKFVKERHIRNRNLMKYHVISSALDCLIRWGQHKEENSKYVSLTYGALQEYLLEYDLRTYFLMCKVTMAQIQLVLNEMALMGLVTIHEPDKDDLPDYRKTEIYLTERGYEAYCNQTFHQISASLYEGKGARILATTSIVIAIIALTASLITLLL